MHGYHRLVLVLLAVVATAIVMPSVASAHAHYKSSRPGKGEVLASAPAQVDIYFTQDIQKVSGTYGIEVNRDRGASVTSGPAVVDEADRSHLTVKLQPDLTPGRYVVQWKNVSDDDGDPGEGAFSFYVQTQPNAVDLQNDQQLEQIGAEEETPGADTTPETTGAATPPAATAAAGGAVAPTQQAPSTPVSTGSSDGGGTSNTGLYIAIGVVAAIVLTGAGGWWWLRQSGTRSPG